MLYASFLLVLLVLGILFYALSTNAKIVELARLTFACAMLAVCLQFGARMVSLLR
jgi:hypothetical protein